ncbi:MAG: hypothetical protein JJ866_24990 [Roseibium sp.]|uniref:hypothetical protein n=1 Tax=Roseibium sp. TaxID=1936156 RepID=UPI001AFD7B8E|nr:hypothetical protein [Roseibium sp.]MBO6895215.1 hypothetical protein [Roseibium sp.]MBO6932336.1 hypothetical protein [Roseibium sp.]
MRTLDLASRLHQTLEDLDGRVVRADVLKELVTQDVSEVFEAPTHSAGHQGMSQEFFDWRSARSPIRSD